MDIQHPHYSQLDWCVIENRGTPGAETGNPRKKKKTQREARGTERSTSAFTWIKQRAYAHIYPATGLCR